MTDRIEVSQPVTAERNKLWAALTEPEHLANWQSDTARLAQDGSLQLGWPTLGVETELKVLERRSQQRLVLASGRSRVTFELAADRLILTHSGLLGQDEVDGVRSSWQVALSLLNHYLDHHFGQMRQVHWSVAAAPTSAATAHVFYTDASALDAWLTRSTSGIGSVGSQCQLNFSWGEALSGVVLAKAAERDVAITWSQRENSVLVFRTLPSPLNPVGRILALCWSHWACPGADHDTRQGLEAGLAALQKLLASRGSA